MAKACTSSKDHGQVGASWWGGKTCLEEMITQQPNMVITLMLRFMQLQYITHSLNILKKKKSTIKDRKFQNCIEFIFSNGICGLVNWHPKLASPCFCVLQFYFELLATKLDAAYSIFQTQHHCSPVLVLTRVFLKCWPFCGVGPKSDLYILSSSTPDTIHTLNSLLFRANFGIFIRLPG